MSVTVGREVIKNLHRVYSLTIGQA
jgi:hypothetical protein